MVAMVAKKTVRIDSLAESAFRYSGYDAIVCVDVLLSGTTYSQRELNCEDARQITENAVGFFRILLEWENKDKCFKKRES